MRTACARDEGVTYRDPNEEGRDDTDGKSSVPDNRTRQPACSCA